MVNLTCNRSSKLRAASFFISEAFVAKRLIVLEPNIGMARNLKVYHLLVANSTEADELSIQLSNQTTVRGNSIQNSN